MGNWKKEYEEIKVPDNMKERMEASIERAKKEKRKVKKVKLWKICASAAAVLAIVLVLLLFQQSSQMTCWQYL